MNPRIIIVRKWRMFESIKTKLWELLKGKDVSLALLYSKYNK
jgi:hypothetical protein